MSSSGSMRTRTVAVVSVVVFVVLVIAFERLHERSIETQDDELVGIGLSGHAPVAEWIVVVVEDADAPRAERNHAFDRLEREGETRPLSTETAGIGDVEEIGDLVFHEEAVLIHVLQVDDEDLLEE